MWKIFAAKKKTDLKVWAKIYLKKVMHLHKEVHYFQEGGKTCSIAFKLNTSPWLFYMQLAAHKQINFPWY